MLNTLAKRFNSKIVKEPIHVWKYWLQRKKPDREFFQCVVLQWYIIIGKKFKNERGPIFVERSPFSSKFIFSQDLFKCHSQIKSLRDRLFSICETVFQPKAYVFLTTPPIECYRRIKKRKQPGDRKISKITLQHLSRLHWMAIQHIHSRGIEAIALDDL